MIARSLLQILFLSATAVFADIPGPPKVFTDPAEAIAHAREGSKKKLILFLLVETLAKDSEAVLAAVNGALDARGGDFVIVRCHPGNAEHRRLFQVRFGQDPGRAPLGVVTTAAGELIVGTNGKSPEAYRLILRAALVRGGIETDAEKIAAIRQEIAAGDREVVSSVFGIEKADLEPEMVALTEVRVWTFQDGTTLRAALLEARGATGVFVKADGSKAEVDFNRLSAADVAFIGKKLGQ